MFDACKSPEPKTAGTEEARHFPAAPTFKTQLYDSVEPSQFCSQRRSIGGFVPRVTSVNVILGVADFTVSGDSFIQSSVKQMRYMFNAEGFSLKLI